MEIYTFAKVCNLNILKPGKPDKWFLFSKDQKVLKIEVTYSFEKVVTIIFTVSLQSNASYANEIFMLSARNDARIEHLLKTDRIKVSGKKVLLVREIEFNMNAHSFGRNFLLNLIELNEKSEKLIPVLTFFLNEHKRIKLN